MKKTLFTMLLLAVIRPGAADDLEGELQFVRRELCYIFAECGEAMFELERTTGRVISSPGEPPYEFNRYMGIARSQSSSRRAYEAVLRRCLFDIQKPAY